MTAFEEIKLLRAGLTLALAHCESTSGKLGPCVGSAIATATWDRLHELAARRDDHHPTRIGLIAEALGNCAANWQQDARIVGNVTADEIAELCRWVALRATLEGVTA